MGIIVHHKITTSLIYTVPFSFTIKIMVILLCGRERSVNGLNGYIREQTPDTRVGRYEFSSHNLLLKPITFHLSSVFNTPAVVLLQTDS